MTTNEIYHELQAATARRNEAIRLEQERQAREAAHQQAIDDEEARIAELQAQLTEQRFQDALGQNDALVDINAAALAALTDTLDAVIEQLRQVQPQLTAVDATYSRQRSHTLNSVDEVLAHIDYRARHDANDPRRDYQADLEYMADVRRRRGAFEPALNVNAGLADWIANAPDEHTRQYRRGIVHALLGGDLFMVTNGFNAKQVMRESVMPRRN